MMPHSLDTLLRRTVIGLALVTLGTAGCEKSGSGGALDDKKKEAAAEEAKADEEKKAAADKKEAAPVEVAPEPEEKEPPKRAGAARPDAPYPLIAVEKVTDDKELAAAVAELKGTGKEKSMRERFEALEKAGKPAAEALIAAMKAGNANVRTQAALILRRMEHRSAGFTQALNDMLLSDPDPDARGIAGRVMVFYLEKDTVPALMEALEKDTTEAVRMHAAWALGAIKDKRATDVLIGALDDEFTDVRLRTVGALKRMKSKKAVPHLVSRLEDSNTLVKTRALEALQKITGKKLGKDMAAWRKKYPAPK